MIWTLHRSLCYTTKNSLDSYRGARAAAAGSKVVERKQGNAAGSFFWFLLTIRMMKLVPDLVLAHSGYGVVPGSFFLYFLLLVHTMVCHSGNSSQT